MDDSDLRSDRQDLTTIFAALNDEACRTIVRETVEEALTADELADRCELSRSVIYRKTEQLVDGGLLERHTRIRTDDRNVTQYRTVVDAMLVEITADDGIGLQFDPGDA